MKPLEKKPILGADGKTMVYVYDGDVDYQPTKTTANYKYYFDNNGKRWKTRPYNQWTSLVARTKDGSQYKENQPTYKDVRLVEDLSNFDDWCSWANEQPCYMWEDENGRLFQLDKDLLFEGNQVYSKETVCFLPMTLNSKITHAKAFYSRREMFNEVFTKYFDVLDERVIERFMDMCKMDYTLSKEPRMSVEYWNDLVSKREHDMPTIKKLSGINQWNDWNDVYQSIICTNGKYSIVVQYGLGKLVQGVFTDAKESILTKLKAKSEKILELKIEVTNFQYFEKDKYLEYLDDVYAKLIATIDGVVSGDIKFKKWVLVDY